jgi:lantibiotic modifying enzyme
MSTSVRHFVNDQHLPAGSPQKELVASLNRLVKDFPPKSLESGGGLYHGPLSIALLFFALGKHYDDLRIANIPMRAWLHAYIQTALSTLRYHNGPRPGKCGVIDEFMALLALAAASRKDKVAARKLCKCVVIAAEPSASNEWLYGRAGYLYLLRLAKTPFTTTSTSTPEDHETVAMIEATADEVIQAIVQSPRPWQWRNQVYVGAVHGIIGILTQIVLTDPSYAPRLEPQLDSLLQNQYESGNWPAILPEGSDRLVHFCHGAPGVVSSLLSIRQYFPNLDDRIDEAIVAGRALIREKGLLTKEPCLCHGASGNALALEGKDFECFLSYTTFEKIQALEAEDMMEPSDHPESLFGGVAGRAWAWAVADKGLKKNVLGYNDI